METKICPKCNKALPINDFYLRNSVCRKPDARRSWCKFCAQAYRKELNTADPSRKTKESAIAKKSYKKNRKVAIEYYGGMCSCCGETQYEFLTFDHVNGKTEEDKKKPRHLMGGAYLYLWLKKNNYPEGFQILCYNCNCAKGYYGQCPHKKEESQDGDRNDRQNILFELECS